MRKSAASRGIPDKSDSPEVEKREILRFAAQMNLRHSPYPPADEAQIYETLCKGAFGRMLAMAEKANDSHIASDEKIIRHKMRLEITLAWLGWSALVLLIILLTGAAVLCALRGHDWVAGALGISGSIPIVAGVIGKFIPGNTSKRET